MEKKLARGIRNNNPLNIKIAKRNNWKGRVPLEQNTDGTFEQYEEMWYGVRAALKLLAKYIQRGENTVPMMINRWCPPLSQTDDSTRIYIDYVMKACEDNLDSFDRKTLVRRHDYETLFVIVSAMCMMESRYRLPSEIFKKAWLDLYGRKNVES